MKKPKIFQIISTFSEKERKDFEDFIKSPLLVVSRDYTQLLRTIYKFVNNSNINEINYKELFAKAYPGKVYNNKTLRNRLNELTSLAKKFIALKTLEKDKNLNNVLLLKGLRERKLHKIFMSEYEKINDISINNDYKTYIISEMKLQYIHVLLENQDFVKTFENYNRYTDYTITMQLEKFFSIMLEYELQKQYGINTENNITYDLFSNIKIDNFISTIEVKKKDDYLILLLYFYLYRSYQNTKDESVYKKFSNLFFGNLNKLSIEQKNDFFGYMISRFFYLINSGSPEYLIEVFKIYNIKLKLGLYSELKEIRYPSTAYRDYVVVGLRLKKYKWVENFIKVYSDQLPPEIRDSEVMMAYARLYIFKNDFDKAIEVINSIKITNYLYVLDASRIKLRAFFEKSYFEEAYLEIDRIKHYIKNNSGKIPASVSKYSKTFLNFYNKLLKIKLNPVKTEIEYLNKTITETPSLVIKDWFLEKLKVMKQAKIFT